MISDGAHSQKSELRFLLVLLTGVFAFAFFIFKPFLYALILAIVFATVFEPLHKKILAMMRGKNGLAAFLATIAVFIIVIAPLAFLGIQIFQEAAGLYSSLAVNGGAGGFSGAAGDAIKSIQRFFPAQIEFSLDVEQYAKQGLNWLLQHLDFLFSNVITITVSAFVFFVALYYLFKDGQKLKRVIVPLSPLQDIYNETILNKLELAITSVIKGTLAVALVQGVISGIGYAIFGVPNAVLWGSVTAIAALIPGIGTGLALIPAIFYLFLSGETLSGFGLLIWGMTAVGLVDNFLGPKLMERGVQLHPFLILLSILGGIAFFGPFGFLLGPLVLSLLSALLEVYFAIRKEQNSGV